MTSQRISVQDALTEATKLVTQAFALIGAVVEQSSQMQDLEALTVHETMARLRKAESTIYQMCRDGRLEMIDERIPVTVIKEYLAGNRQARKQLAARGSR